MDSSRTGSGGATASGGALGSGGSNASGGTSASGGHTQTGGASGTGGTGTGGAGTGGQNSGGGGANSQGSGGAPRTGGTSGSTGGSSVGGAAGNPGGGGRQGGTGGSGIGGSADASQNTIVPDASWTCGMPDGIPAPTKGTLVFHATLQIGMSRDAGLTNFGKRKVIDIKGGTTTGTRLQATVLTGGFDFELTLSNGSIELEQIDVLRASDGTLIYMRTCGVAPAGATEVRIVPDFEVATSKSLAWLNTGKFVGTRIVDSATGTVQLDIYDVASVTVGDPKIRIVDPTDRPQQPWDCAKLTGTKGASVFTENVTLGSSLAVGASKRGTRNIIPITGGTVTGRFAGTVLPGGADYQLIGGTTTLDARYVLQSSDGVLLVVRNCGPFGALIPTFETKADGPYAFLNANTFFSSDPATGSGGVSITFNERK